MLERIKLDLISGGSAHNRRLVVSAAVAIFALVFALRAIIADTSAPVGFFYGVPVTIVALYFSTRAATGAAIAAVALTAIAVLIGHSSAAAVAVAALLVPVAAGIAKAAAVMREVAVKSRDAEDRLATVVETVLEGYLEMDARGRVVEINAEAQKLFGWPREDIVGRDLPLTLLPRETRGRFRASLEATLEGREAPLFGRWHDEWTGIRRDGGRLTVEWMVAPVCQGGEWSFPIWIFDVTGGVRRDEARARLAAIIESVPAAFVAADADGVIRAWNPEAVETFGWTVEEAIGRRLSETIVPERHRKACEGVFARLAETGAAPGVEGRIEVEGRHRDGHAFPMELSVATVAIEDGVSFHAFMRDVSDRRREEGVRNRMASIVEASGDAIYSYTPAGVVTSWNPGAERLYGFSAEEMVGTDVARIAAPDRPDDHRSILSRVTRGQRLEDYEAVSVAKGGRTVHVALTVSPVKDEGGRVVEAAVIARDVSQRKRLETYRENQYEATRLLAEAEEPVEEIPKLLAILGEGSGWPCGALWYRDGDDRRFRCAAVWRSSVVQAEVCPFEEGQVDELDEDPPAAVAWRKVGEAERGVDLPGLARAREARIGTALWVPVTIDGRVLGAVELLTRRVLDREEELIAATSAVSSLLTELMKRRHAETEAERLKDEFFGMVSHEMSTPLTSILGYTELLGELEAGRLSGQGRGFLEVIGRNARREMRLVGDLLALVRIEAGSFSIEPEPVVLATVAREAADAAAPHAERGGVKLTATLEPVPKTIGDPHRLGQVIDNLLSNAIKFTPEGGAVDLRLERRGERAVLEVADTGIGIPAGEQQKLFERLYRASGATERQIEGLGLGLAIAKAIVDAHDGTIAVESEVGKGTAFRVELPLRAPGDAQPAPAAEAERGAAVDPPGSELSRSASTARSGISSRSSTSRPSAR